MIVGPGTVKMPTFCTAWGIIHTPEDPLARAVANARGIPEAQTPDESGGGCGQEAEGTGEAGSGVALPKGVEDLGGDDDNAGEDERGESDMVGAGVVAGVGVAGGTDKSTGNISTVSKEVALPNAPPAKSTCKG
jgi:hypothetical protein